MGNTELNKGKFFAQYYGQKVQRWHQWIETTQNGEVHLISPMKSGLLGVDDGWFLQLKPLSEISDEDAIEVAKINGSITSNNLLVGKAICHWLNVQGTNRDMPFEAVDYLRSKSYLLPYNGLSVEKIIEYGWAKIKN